MRRTLGFYAAFTISLGAMIGSGIFVLPGLAFSLAGPAAALAYALAGMVVIPAALSQSEMATAMPESGGTYLYVDRAMGPLMGTIAGFGVWFSLVFKASFALVGLGAYLALFADFPAKPFALAMAVVITVVNLVGARHSGVVQRVLVTLVMATLGFFLISGSQHVDTGQLTPFLPEGFGGLLAAAGLVSVSYAGVMKVASVAEEVKRPSWTLPRAILMSTLLMVVLYPVIMLVIIGNSGGIDLTKSATPVTDSAGTFLGSVGVDLIAAVAVLALIGVANAALLASSRYPLAMARRGLAPAGLQRIGARSGTPIVSILFTSGVLILLIATVPILELAKLASAFQLLVLALVNVAVIAFREGGLRWYRPTFRSPLYPWMQIAGIGGSIVLITQMGLIPLLGALGILGGGIAFYHGFGRSRASRESASLDALRVRNNSRLVAMTEMALADRGVDRILIPVFGDLQPARQRDLVRVARHLASPDAKIDIVRFSAAEEAAEVRDPSERVVGSTDGPLVRTGRVVSNDIRGAVSNYVWDRGVDLVLAEMPQDLHQARSVVRDLKWLRDNLPCNTIFLRNRNLEDLQSIVIMGSGGPFDVLKISLASRIAEAEGAAIRFVHVVNEEATEAQMGATRAYHTKLDELTAVDTESEIERAENLVVALTSLARGANLVVLGSAAQRYRMFSDLADRIAEQLDCPVLLVHATDSHRRTMVGGWLERFIY
ncbi:amino acid permease [bacterium]|nr:amino acid permease [bacterium]